MRGVAGRKRVIAWAAGGAIATAVLGGLATDLSPWYYALRQPPWKPPDWLFGPAWTVIFTLTAAAAVLAWEACPAGPSRRRLLAAFALNALLNIAWSWLFFTLRRPDWARIEVVLLVASVALLIVLAGRLRPLAGWLLLPYLLWTGFAGWLNHAVVQLNA
ncbi:TspO/MBR family protein [Pseudorhodoferax sp. Leaf267]|uniref:TspO/MBR family protein n=1 Tax=Pseudorhodoferax sp. Leaf267 TaxID=1736316 RepID=UPI0006F8879F|nr:TspO/MBR family protein [Pseudorhodoferax sp. Leaf267]KQP18250.1 TspO protein [Pseudorhodoferax sp. Leaf267]